MIEAVYAREEDTVMVVAPEWFWTIRKALGFPEWEDLRGKPVLVEFWGKN